MDANYNPFDEDEQIVGIEQNGAVFKPGGSGNWGGEFAPTKEQRAMLFKGRRRERGLGSEEDNKRGDEEDAQAEAERAARAADPEADYKPKVSTWGVFPRPDNISKSYGGGKTIKAGEFVVETEEQKAERRARVQAKLAQYREDQGMNIPNGTLVRWQAALNACQTFMRQGKMSDGLAELEDIVLTEKCNPRSDIGGEITLHYAMCLDNLQRREEALEMYKRCVGCPHGKVSKFADRMIFGMTTASKKMKADQFDYDGIKDKYDPFLIRMTNERKDWQIEQMSPEEEAELNRVTYGSIAFVAAVPIFMGIFIAMQ